MKGNEFVTYMTKRISKLTSTPCLFEIELQNGRLAMIAIGGLIHHSIITGNINAKSSFAILRDVYIN